MAVQAGIKIGVEGEREYRQALSNINQQTKELKSEMDLLTSSFDKNASAQEKAGKQSDVLRKQIDNQADKVDLLRKRYADQQKELERLEGNLESAKKEYGENSEQAQKAEAELAKYQKTVSQTKTDLNKAETELNKLNQQLEKTESDAAGADKALEEVPGTLDRISSGAEKAAEKLGNISEGLENAAQKTAAISAAAAAALGGTALLAANYEDAIAKVSTIADESAVSMDDMSTAIMDLSNETGVAATDLAEAVYQAISAGQDTADAVNFVANATKLARAGFTDTGSALDVLTTILNAYGLEAEKVGDVSDILIQTQNLGKTSVAELAATMGKVIPTAAAFGVELDQLGAAYATITANGVQTKIATTYLNALLNELGKSGTKVSTILEEKTGKSFSELSAEGYSLADVLAIVKEDADENGLALNDLFSSSEAAKAGLILLGDSADAFNSTLGKMRSSSGSTNTAFGKLDTTSYRVQRTINEFKNTATDLGNTVLELVAPSLEKFADFATTVREAVESMDDETKRQIVAVLGLTAAISPALGILSKLTSAASGVASAISAMVSNPAILAIVGASAAVAGVALAINAVNEAHRESIEAATSAALAEHALSEEQTALIENAGALAENLSATRAATDEAAASIGFQRDRATELIDELKSLADENGNVTEANRAQAEVIIGELNTAFGLELELVDGQISGYDELERSIRDVIDAKTAEALLDRRRDDYLDALEAETQQLDALHEAQNAVAEAEDAANAARARARELHQLDNATNQQRLEFLAEYGITLEEATEQADAAVEAWNEELDTRRVTLAGLESAYRDSYRTITNYEAAQVAAMRGDTDRVIELLTGRENAWHDYGDAVDAETAVALDAMYNEVVAAAEYAAEVRTNWENGVDGYTESMVREAEYSFTQMRDAFADAYDEAQDIGFQFISGLDYGLNSQKNQLLSTVNSIAGIIPHGMRDVLGIYSPSRVAAEIGRYFDEGLAQGLEQNADMVRNAAEDGADNMVGAFSGISSVFGAGSMGSVVGNTTSNAVDYGGVSITVNANDQMTAREIADAVMQEMQNAVDRKRAVYA